MSLEHEFEEIMIKSIEKGTVKAVEKLIDKGLITEIVEITLNTIEQELLKIIGIGVVAAIATGGIESAIVNGAQKTIQEVVKSSKEATIKKIQDIVVNMLKNKYDDFRGEVHEKEIREIQDIEILSSILENKTEFGSLDELLSNYKAIN